MVQYSEGFLRRKRQALVYVPRERLHGERIKTQNTVRIMYEQASGETRRICDVKQRGKNHI